MDNSLFLSYLSIKTPVFMDNPLFSLYLSIKTTPFVDERDFLSYLSIKKRRFVDVPVYYPLLRTRTCHSMDKGPSITQCPDTLSNKAAILRVSSLRVN